MSPGNGEAVASDMGSAGPLTWLATFGLTTLLLVSLQHALWLVVPFLLAIVLYYILFPAVRYLSRAGMSHESAAATVLGLFSAGTVLVMIPFAAWIVANSASGEAAFWSYVESGKGLIGRLLGELEARFGFMAQWDLQNAFPRKASELGQRFVQEHVTGALIGAVAWVPSLLLAPFLAFFFLRDGRRFVNRLIRVVPNAFFERTVYMFDSVHQKARSYFQGLLKLAAVDAVLYTIGLWLIGISGAPILGIVAALMSWIPVVGTAIACVMIVLAAAAAFPGDPWVVYAAITMFLVVRMLDTFIIMPMTVGRSIQIHPLPTVLMLFIGGTVAGVPGLILALPLAAVVSTIVGTVGAVIDAPRLRARHRFAKVLEARRINIDLQP